MHSIFYWDWQGMPNLSKETLDFALIVQNIVQFHLQVTNDKLGIELFIKQVRKHDKSFSFDNSLFCMEHTALAAAQSIQSKELDQSLPLRCWLQIMNLKRHAIRFSKEMKTYYDTKIKEGKHHLLVMNNICNKLVHRILLALNEKNVMSKTISQPIVFEK